MKQFILAALLFCALSAVASSSAVAQQGTLSSNSPCQLGTGQTSCNVQVNWTTSNSPISCLWLSDGHLFACGGGASESHTWPHTTVTGTEFVLRSHPDWNHVTVSGTELARIFVRAQGPAPAPAGSLLSNSPCSLLSGAGSCSVTLSWSTTHSPVSCVWTQGGSLFACSGSASDTAVWPYATMQPGVMILRSHPSWSQIDVSGTELARTSVWALSPNISPTVALLTPAAEGFAGHKQTAITLTATAADSDGVVQRVDYLVNGSVIGSGYAGNFLFNWSPPSSGEFAIVARAHDNGGASSVSVSRRVIIAEYGLPTMPATYGTADQYYPMFLGNTKTTFRGVSNPDGSPHATWSIPGANGVWDFHWPQPRVAFNPDLDLGNTTWERWQRRFNCTNSSSWLYVNSYHQRTSIPWSPGVTEANHDTAISTTRALFDYQGRIYDITNVCGSTGQPYVPNSVTGQPMRIRVWGLLGGGPGKWFWEARYSYSSGVTNSCWQGSGSSTRPAILQSEGWWDQNGGWMDGPSGGSGAMDSGGVPNGLDVVMVRDGAVAYQAGYAWAIRSGAHLPPASQWQACSINTVGYTFPSTARK